MVPGARGGILPRYRQNLRGGTRRNVTVGMGCLLLPCLVRECRMLLSYVRVRGAGALQLLELVRLSLCGLCVHLVGVRRDDGLLNMALLGESCLAVQLFEPITMMSTVMWFDLLDVLMGSVNALGL